MAGLKKYFITVNREDSLENILAAHLPGGVAGETVIGSGGVWLEKKRILAPDHPVRSGQTLVVYTSSGQGSHYRLPPEHIIFEDRDLLAVYKPPLINVQADWASLQNNLTSGVNDYLATGYQAIPLTRLDFPVQGLVLYARHKRAERELFELSRERKIHKLYTALIEPGMERGCLRVKDRLGFGRKAVVSKKGKPAHSLFIFRQDHGTARVYSVILFTGRRHQIRFHAANYLAPIVGDRLYGSRSKAGKGGIGLVCSGYNFTFRGGRFRLRLPDLHERLDTIGRR